MVSHAASTLAAQLAAEGVSLWLDDPDPAVDPLRTLTEAGPSHFVGWTAAPDVTLPVVRAACDLLLERFLAGSGRSGRVSVGLAPWAAHDAVGLVSAARAVVHDVNRPNLLVRLAATPAGLSAVAECLGLGIAVHVSPVYSCEQFALVLRAYLAGMEQALANGVPLARVAFVASFPVGLLDDEADALLERADPALLGQAGRAVARLAYRQREEALSSHWWRVLRSAGAPPPLLSWTETRPRHLAELVGENTVLSVSPSTLETAGREVEPHGDTLLGAHLQAARVVAGLRAHGVDLDRLAAGLPAVEQ